MEFLTSHHFNNVNDTDKDDQFTHWDVTATYDGYTVAFELKNRDCYSWEYEDTEINKYKYDDLLASPYDKVILVTFYIDFWCMVNLRTTPPTKIYSKMASLSHRWNRGKNIREFVNWNLKDKNIQLMEYK